MAIEPQPGRGEQPRCPTCQDAGWLPNPFPAHPGDFVVCPYCHQDYRWTTQVEPGIDLPSRDYLAVPLLEARALINGGFAVQAAGQIAAYRRLRQRPLLPHEEWVVGYLDHVAILLGICADLLDQGRADLAGPTFRTASRMLDEARRRLLQS
jgi:hypothetical protein